jgi:hypothetical protein
MFVSTMFAKLRIIVAKKYFWIVELVCRRKT